MNDTTNTNIRVVELTKRVQKHSVRWDADSAVFRKASALLARRTAKTVAKEMNFSSNEFTAELALFTRHSLVVVAAMSALKWNIGCDLPLTEEAATVVTGLRRARHTQGAVMYRLRLETADKQVFQTALEGIGAEESDAADIATSYAASRGQGGNWGGSVAEILYDNDVFAKANMVRVNMQEPGDPDVLMSSRVTSSKPLQVRTPATSLTSQQMLHVVMFGLDGPDLGDFGRVLQAGDGELNELFSV